MGVRSFFSSRKKKLKIPSSSSTTSSPQTPSSPCPSSPHMYIDPSRNVQEMEEIFKKFDSNGDGKISSSELASIMANLGYKPTEEELERMMKEVDADGDGFIDFNEFIELNTKGVDSEKFLEDVKNAFTIFDVDGDGSISVHELHRVLKNLGDNATIEDCRKMINATIEDCRKMINAVDIDGNGFICFEEFKQMMIHGGSDFFKRKDVIQQS